MRYKSVNEKCFYLFYDFLKLRQFISYKWKSNLWITVSRMLIVVAVTYFKVATYPKIYPYWLSMRNLSGCPFWCRGWKRHWLIKNYEILSPNFGSGSSGIRNGSADHWNVTFPKWPFVSEFVSKKLRICFDTLVWKMGQGGSINCVSLEFGFICQRLLPVHTDLCKQLC